MKYALILLAVFWVSKSFIAVDDMVVFLNKMPVTKQHTARIYVAEKNSFSSPTTYYLVYQK